MNRLSKSPHEKISQNISALEAFTIHLNHFSDRDFRRLYHRVVLCCARTMEPADFIAALNSASESIKAGA
jgi:hypothetical protein